MKRLIDQDLKNWKNSTGRKSLILRGARQVGKTFSARQLGKTYPDFYEINLEKRVDLHSMLKNNAFVLLENQTADGSKAKGQL